MAKKSNFKSFSFPVWCWYRWSQGTAAEQQAFSESRVPANGNISNYNERWSRKNFQGAGTHREYILGYLYD